MESIEPFLRALFAHVPPGVIEVRIIEDKKDGIVVERKWFESVDSLIADISRLNNLSDSRHAGVFFGVLPRRARGHGDNESTGPGLAVWVDIDFRDFAGGEDEARKRLAAFPFAPSILVRSGHGLHAYWLLREPSEPAVLSTIAKSLAGALGGDHVHDAARIMRLPGSSNWKDPSSPALVTIEKIETSLTVNPSELVDVLNTIVAAATSGSTEPKPDPEPTTDDEIKIHNQISARVLRLLETNSRLFALFHGTGKPAVDDSGKRLDTTASGYDYSIAVELAFKGVRDPSELATVLWRRPDDSARIKGLDYVKRTVRKALFRVENVEQDKRQKAAASIDFTVDALEILQSDPALYKFTIESKTFTVTSKEIASRQLFATRFLDAVGRLPRLPPARGAWEDVINALLAKADRTAMPPEASDDAALRDDIERTIEQLAVGEDPVDLDSGKALTLENGKKGFKTRALTRPLHEDYPDLKNNRICQVLRALGFESVTPQIGDKAVRVWVRSEK